MKIKTVYFENEGFVDYGYYLEINGKRVTIENSNDSRYPIERVFHNIADCYEYVITTYIVGVEILC
jgi:hypothetical protein